MLHLIPAPLHRGALRLAHAARLRWWRIRRPLLRGSRVLAFDAGGEVLLVRHSYGSGRWMLPGGGLSRREDPLEGARRECLEETGCALARACRFAVVEEPLSGAVNRVHLVTGVIAAPPRADGREIAEARCFAPGALPADLSPALEASLERWIAEARAALVREAGPQA